MAIFSHARKLGLVARGKILATGGSSENQEMMQILSDIFGVPVYTGDLAKSAAVGAAYKALHGWKCSTSDIFVPFSSVVGETKFKLTAKPSPSAENVYKPLVEKYTLLEEMLIKLKDKS